MHKISRFLLSSLALGMTAGGVAGVTGGGTTGSVATGGGSAPSSPSSSSSSFASSSPFALFAPVAKAAPLAPVNLRVEYLKEPLGVDVAQPRFSWELAAGDAAEKGKKQSAYEVAVFVVKPRQQPDAAAGNAPPQRRRPALEQVWTTGKVAGSASNQIAYAGGALKPFTTYFWRVRVWDESGAVSERSRESRSFFTTGPLSLADWAPAQWIGEPKDGPGAAVGKKAYHDALPPSPYLRKEFALPAGKRIARAFFHSSAQGFYHLTINGQKVGKRLLAPERSVYEKHLMFQTEDVSKLLAAGGANVIGVELADGWYAGGVWSGPNRGANHGSLRRFIGKLNIVFTDGTSETLVTDGSWQFLQEGARSNAAIMGGETFTAANQQPGWDKPGFNAAAAGNAAAKWTTATVYGAPDATTPLVAQLVEPVHVVREFRPVSVKPVPGKPGAYIFDIGQNIAGWCRLTLPYNPGAGSKIVLRHFEMPNPDGSIYTANLRGARPVDVYIPAGETSINYEPRFTFHGFRYVQVEGLTRKPDADVLTGIAISSGAPETGEVVTANADINKLWSNIRWSQWDNQISIPTDCPQRDEREGWMADAQVFAQNAIYNLDMAAFYTKWCRDIRDDQFLDGRFPDIAPIGARRTGAKYPDGKGPSKGWNGAGSPGWSDAGVIVPWRVWENYADRRILEASFDSFKRYVDHLHKANPNHLWQHSRNNDFGDWLHGSTFRSPPDAYPRKGAEIPKEAFATAYYYYSTKITADTARLLGRDADAAKYTKLAADIRDAFRRAYLRPDGKLIHEIHAKSRAGKPYTRLLGDNQGSYAMLLALDLVNPDERPNAVNRLVSDLQHYDWRLSTGFHSTIWMMNELSKAGRTDVAYKLLLSRRFPSWLYSIDNGATTIWERWDGYVKGRGFQSPGMNSFNHYSLGAVGEWMYAHMLGIKRDPAAPGWTHFFLAPQPPRWFRAAPCATTANATANKEPCRAIAGAALSNAAAANANITGAAAGELKILRATYGVLGDKAHELDATALLAAAVKNNTLKLAATNENLGGDPADGTVKELRVEYLLNGAKHTLTIAENEDLQIPVPTGAAKLATATAGETTAAFTPLLDAPADAPKWARGHYRAITGTITAAWKYSDDGTRFTYTVTVPPNTTATVTLPFSRRTFPIGSGTYTWTEDVK